ncbi:uncharacterized protein [Battus philenor]|uniref:uncharacterized protein n=1 Tax=Battus philenor TaxID=42288 RepID=UPI0035D047CC
MPDERKQKKNDPKEQRKSRRRHEVQAEKKDIKQTAPVNKEPDTPKVPVLEKPAYEPPGPEFYKNLKRETDEILKITEEANSKYKKKEIQSNWAKYEMPIDSYNDIEEQENMGADYEALIQASSSVGGHFQFKHEKSWDISTGPSIYDKYFEIDMDNLAIALSSIPFYERNSIDQTIFNETDILNMNHRATKFKQKYFNDKTFTTPELEVQEKILKQLSSKDVDSETVGDKILNEAEEVTTKDIDFTEKPNNKAFLEEKPVEIIENNPNSIANGKDLDATKPETPIKLFNTKEVKTDLPNFNSDIKLVQNKQNSPSNNVKTKHKGNKMEDDIDDIINIVETKAKEVEIKPEPKNINLPQQVIKDVSSVKEKEPNKNPIIESPEDLEKWLDDFLDD